MKNVQLSTEEIQALVMGLNMRRAYIETGDPCTTADTAQKIGKPDMIKPLSIDQMKAIILIDELTQKLFR